MAEEFGAPKGDKKGPLGGGTSYIDIITTGDFVVSDYQELRSALTKAVSDQVIFIDGQSEIDMTVWVKVSAEVLNIPDGVTLARPDDQHRTYPFALRGDHRQKTR